MINPIKQIHDFNHKAGLVDKGYNDFLESSFQIEEALEGHNALSNLAMQLSMDDESASPKNISREIVAQANYNHIISDVDRFDKACDAVVYAVGSMTKLGLNPQQITRGLNVVMNANMAKLGCPKDEHGKLMKPDNFDELYAPEPRLQQILDERK